MKRSVKILLKKISGNKIILVVFAMLLLVIACQKEYLAQPPPPKVAKQTSDLEASYTTTAPITVTDKFWKGADYVKIIVKNLNIDSLYGNGLLNMTGTKSGTASFNGGKDPDLTMKAAYDNSKLYLFIQWSDASLNPRFGNSIYTRDSALYIPTDPFKPGEDAHHWTSQGNSDRVALAFDIDGASSGAGTFSQTGCAASCHNNQMQTSSGKVDIWHWNLVASDALGYANDMVCDAASGLTDDAGTGMTSRNKSNINDNRSAPAYEWDGTTQTLTRPDGKKTTLDPGFYLLNKTSFLGNASNGDNLYHNAGNCVHCHGADGEGGGDGGDGPAFNNVGFARTFSRAAIKNFASGASHEGKDYFNSLSSGLQDDLIAYIKGLGTLPGYYLAAPTGSSADVWSVSNVSRTRIGGTHTTYQVILIRDLVTPNADDIQFSSPQGKSYPYGVALMDNDGKNHIGSFLETLTFLTH